MSSDDDNATFFIANGLASNAFVHLYPIATDAADSFAPYRKYWSRLPVANVCPVALNERSLWLEPLGNFSIETDEAFINIVYENLDGKPIPLQRNTIVKKDQVYILTLTGDLIKSRANDHWRDATGANHLPSLCEECRRCQAIGSSVGASGDTSACPSFGASACPSVEWSGDRVFDQSFLTDSPIAACASCFYSNNIATLQSALCGLDFGLAGLFLHLANELYFEPASEGYEKGKRIKATLMELAKDYAKIESEAKRFVRMTKEYGENVQDAHSLFEEDDDFQEFVTQVENTRGLHKKFEEVTNSHAVLRAEVEALQTPAKCGGEEMRRRARDLDEKRMTESVLTAVGTGTGVSGVTGGAVAVGVKAAPKLVAKLGGRGGAIGLAVVGGAAILTLLGAGGYYLYKQFTQEAKNDFKKLAEDFDRLGVGIEKVSRHLHLIEESLRNIETKWRRIVDVDGGVVGVSGTKLDPGTKEHLNSADILEEERNRKREKRLAAAILKKVSELIVKCDEYERLVKQDRSKLLSSKSNTSS